MLTHYSHVRLQAKRKARDALSSGGSGGSYGTAQGRRAALVVARWHSPGAGLPSMCSHLVALGVQKIAEKNLGQKSSWLSLGTMSCHLPKPCGFAAQGLL